MSWVNDLWVIGLTGATAAGVLGWPLLRWPAPAGDARTLMRLLGVIFLVSAPVLLLISAMHGQLLPQPMALPVGHIVYASNLTFWALFIVWVRRAVGLETGVAAVAGLTLVPLLIYIGLAAIAGNVPPFLWLLPAGCVASFYACTRVVAIGAHRSGEPEHLLLTRVVTFGVALNTAQLIRTFWPDVEALREIVPITMTVGVLLIAAVAMRGLIGARRQSDSETVTPRYARSALDEATAAQLLADLDDVMDTQRVYRDPDLSLIALAARIGVGPHLISQALNQRRGCSLNEYLSARRVTEAAKLLADPSTDRLTIDAIAEEAGFRSRSAFYKTFKARMGLTPTAYRARIRG
jgi:AraC-like DNA-binding protein